MQVLRTPEERFANLPDFPYQPHYIEVSDGLRMAWVEEGAGDEVFLCLHGEPSWSFLYRKMMPILAQLGRVIAPDLIGFGRSDKPTDREAYTYGMHYDALTSFITNLDLKNITLICQDWGGLLGLPIAMNTEDRFARLVIMNTGLPTGGKPLGEAFMKWRAFATRSDDLDVSRVLQRGTQSELSDATLAAYDAPYPDKTYKVGAIVFPLLVPISRDAPALGYLRGAVGAMKKWDRPTLVIFSDSDPITAGNDEFFRTRIPAAADEPKITVRNGGHFLQEDGGEEIAGHIVQFVKRRPLR